MGAPGDGRPDADGEPVVALSAVNKHVGTLYVLNGIDLRVRRVEVVVVLGPSGSGKSTVCRAINRRETIESGRAREPRRTRRG